MSGYTTSNIVYPDDKVAITVYTNIYPGVVDAPGSIADRISRVILTPPPANAERSRRAQSIYANLAKGSIVPVFVHTRCQRVLRR